MFFQCYAWLLFIRSAQGLFDPLEFTLFDFPICYLIRASKITSYILICRFLFSRKRQYQRLQFYSL